MNRKGLDMRRKHCAAFVHPVRAHRTQEFTNVVFYTRVYKSCLLRSENKINIFHDRQNQNLSNNVVKTLVRRIGALHVKSASKTEKIYISISLNRG